MGLSDLLGGVPVIGNFLQPHNEPIYQNRPTALKSLINKYSTNDWSAYDQNQVDALQQIDLQRANRGQAPIPVKDSQDILQGMQQGTPYYPEPRRNPTSFLGNAVQDIKDIAYSIPKLPVSLVKEVGDVVNFGPSFKKVQDQPGGNFLSDILQAPGIRMIPGAFTASNLAKGDFSNLVSHPVMTALDVMPAASELGLFDVIKDSAPFGSLKNSVRDWMYRSPTGRIAWQLGSKERNILIPLQGSSKALEAILADPEKYMNLLKTSMPEVSDALQIQAKLQEVMSTPEFQPILQLPDAEKARIAKAASEGKFNELSPIEKDFASTVEAWNTYRSYIVQKTTGELVLVPDFTTTKDLMYNRPDFANSNVYFNKDNGWYQISGSIDPQVVFDATKKAFMENARPAFEIYRPVEAKRITQTMHSYTLGRVNRYAADLNEEIKPRLSATGRITGYDSTPYIPSIQTIKDSWDSIKPWADDFKLQAVKGVNVPMEEAYKGFLFALQKNGIDISEFFVKGNPAMGFKKAALEPVTIDRFMQKISDQSVGPQSMWLDHNNIIAYLQSVDSKVGRVAVSRIEDLSRYALKGSGADVVFKEALAALDDVKKIKSYDSSVVDDIRKQIYIQREYNNWRSSDTFNRAAKFDPIRKLDVANKYINKMMPARYKDYLADYLRRRVFDSYNYIQKQTHVFTPEEWDQVSQLALEGAYDSLSSFDRIFADRGVGTHTPEIAGQPYTPKNPEMAQPYALSVNRIRDAFREDVQATLNKVRAEGAPVAFVHRVSPRAVEAMNFQRILDSKITPTQFKERVLDPTPWVQDLQISSQHAAFEIIHRAYFDELFKQLVDPNGTLAEQIYQDQLKFGKSYGSMPDRLDSPIARTYKQVEEELRTQYDQLWNRGYVDPTLDYNSGLKRFIEDRYVKWDPEGIVNFKSSRFSPKKKAEVKLVPVRDQNGVVTGQQPVLVNYPDIYVPQPFMKAIKEMSKQYEVSRIWDPVMNAFRMAVLPFSPRFHVHNILGGAMMTMMDTGVTSFLSNIGDAKKLLAGEEVFDPATKALIQASPEFQMMLGQNKMFVREFQSLRGQGLANKLAETWGVDPKNVAALQGNIDKAKDVLYKAADFSYRFNQITDDLYRAVGYITEYKKVIKEFLDSGMSEEAAYAEAGKRGMQAVRRVMHSWDQMSPIERSVIRNVIPFYGFMSHMVKFAFKFPYDHPFRAATIASFSRNELDDLKFLPDKFLAMIPLPWFDHPDGSAKFVSMIGANPFSDLADVITLRGFAGTVNPLITTIGQQLGVDFMSGGPQQGPLTGWDPFQARTQFKPPNIFSQLLSSTIPQSNIITAPLGLNPEYNSLAINDPNAAKQYLMSSMGLPAIIRSTNTNVEAIKAQVAAKESLQTNLDQALKSGAYNPFLQQYPQLSPLLNQIGQIQGTTRINAFTPDVISSQNTLLAMLTQPYARTTQGSLQNLQQAQQELASARR